MTPKLPEAITLALDAYAHQCWMQGNGGSDHHKRLDAVLETRRLLAEAINREIKRANP